jgi:periplasmic divalent cation tolerance protein
VPDCILVMCACGTKANAEEIASELVQNKLAACVQLQSIESFYWWQDRVHHDPEILLLIKSTEARYAEIEATIKRVHTYELPEISKISIEGGSPEYLDWIRGSVRTV